MKTTDRLSIFRSIVGKAPLPLAGGSLFPVLRHAVSQQ